MQKDEGLRTLVVVQGKHDILLGMKKRGFGMGRWNGFGGHPENQESAYDAAVRELAEESGLCAVHLTPVGDLEFSNQAFRMRVIIYLCDSWTGEPRDNEECFPAWFSYSDIPFDNMWPDDRHWLPLVLAGKTVKGFFRFGENTADLQGMYLVIY